MANLLYDNARNEFLKGNLDWTGITAKAVLVDTANYAVNAATHKFLSDIPAAARVATATLTGKTAVAGVADANDTTFAGVTGASVEAVVIYEDTGDATTSRLIAYIDTSSGLPITPNGSDIIIQWNNGTNKIFRI